MPPMASRNRDLSAGRQGNDPQIATADVQRRTPVTTEDVSFRSTYSPANSPIPDLRHAQRIGISPRRSTAGRFRSISPRAPTSTLKSPRWCSRSM